MAFVPITIVPSSNILAVEYEADTKTLRIVFVRDQRTYLYHDVDSTTAEGFRTSGLSAGRYFRASIMNRYAYEEET